MKLENVLSNLNQVEKNKFINVIDNLTQENNISKQYNQIKQATNNKIVALFKESKPYFHRFLLERLSYINPSISILTDILSRDGNSVARVSWIETLYYKDLERLQQKAKELSIIERDSDSFSEYEEKMHIYYSCLSEAYNNDIRNNQEPKINDDERSILNVLSSKLNINNDDKVVIEYMIRPCDKQHSILDYLNELRSLGIIFIKNKEQTIYIADETVEILNEIKGKAISDKYLIRVLRSLTDVELSNILKSQNQKIRGIERTNKINNIVHLGLDIRKILSIYMFNDDVTQNERKERLKILIDDLNIDTRVMGTTVDARINIIIDSLKNISKIESNILSSAGYDAFLEKINEFFNKYKSNDSFFSLIREQFEIEDIEKIDSNKLRQLSITPYDILYIVDNQDVKEIAKYFSLSNRGNIRANIIGSFNDATDKLIENYDLLANRDINALSAKGLSLSEAEIGTKFEEATRSMLEQLGLNVDEELRKEINTVKDKVDLIISTSDDDVIIGEMKTYKGGGYSSYSSIARQTKLYVKLCEQHGKNVTQVLVIAPDFTDDFIEHAELDPDINISILEAQGLYEIYQAYKSKKIQSLVFNGFKRAGY
ncbi:conserved hypothetical protein [Francisella tularensis subsp. mediasiatica FSC147]|nr:conserved hypothetical protein [Francisella tularensis subsp. mediasiatica FSC147]MBK2078592.1 hypothetical protein [Francisella tularensis subsp. mediasiatica]MBK2102325.1 hypothetical protein [Francisella tularensis subsp. mediasiatica]MBK2104530.1 hypothetical protein [Francisella tularensis subsp. mediasiatica]NVG85730.1 hypothetical protein [Francisella tularensis]